MPIKDLRDKKCLLTGAASGIGEATALLAASKGAEVFLTDINAEGLADTARRIEAAGGKVGVAKAIDVGVEKNRYMVYSSPDIRFGHFVQRKFELPYAIAMRALNSRISALAKKL